MDQQDKMGAFAAMSIPKAVIKNVVPTTVGMIMVLVYNLADTFFIGMTHNDLQVAAVSLGTPVFMLFMAIGQLFGMGGVSVISRALGAGRREYAKRVCSFCMWACIAVGIALSAAMLLLMDSILAVIGTSPDTIEFTRDYLQIAVLGGPLFLIGGCYSNIVRVDGRPTTAMIGMLLGNLVNVILDPIMILTFGWGIRGAAIATVIGNAVGALFYLIYFISGKSSLTISLRFFTLRDGVCVSVLAIGLPSAIGSVMMSVSQIAVNSLISGYGDMAIAAYGVTGKVMMVVGLAAIGFGQGIQPLLGFSVGANDRERFTGIMKFSLICSSAVQIVIVALCYVFTGRIIGAFLTDQGAYTSGVYFARVMLCTGILFSGQYAQMNALQSAGDSVGSLIISLSRQGLIFIPAAFVLNAVAGLNGIVWAQPMSDLLSLILVVILYKRILPRIFKSGTVGV